jgi:hypothetical protein
VSSSQKEEPDRKSWLAAGREILRRRKGSARAQRMRRALQDRLKLHLRPKGESESKPE